MPGFSERRMSPRVGPIDRQSHVAATSPADIRLQTDMVALLHLHPPQTPSVDVQPEESDVLPHNTHPRDQPGLPSLETYANPPS